MPLGRVLAIALAVAAVCWLMVDSGAFSAEPRPKLMSMPMLILSLVFGLSAWATHVAGQAARAPLLAGLSLGLGAYAVARLVWG